MRVALVHMRSAKVGGTETVLNQLAHSVCSGGHEVSILCRSHQGPPHPDANMVVLRRFAPLAGWRLLGFARDVEQHLEDHSYDIVLGLGRTWSQDILRLGGGCHATYLARAHDHTHPGLRRWTAKFSSKHRVILGLEARALAPGACRRVVVNSQFVRRDIVARYGVDEAAIRVIRNAVDLERFHPDHRQAAGRALRRELGLDGEGPVVLFLGSSFGRKGLDLLLAALVGLRARIPGARMLVVGRDAHPGHWKSMAQRLGVADAVTFLGPRRDVEACFGAADVYALPTRYDSFAFTVLEAMASGLPVVVSDSAGAAEVVTPEAGTVLPWTSPPEEIAEALARWCEPAALEAGRLAARAQAERHGTSNANAEFLALFEEVAAEKAGSVVSASDPRGVQPAP